MVVGGYVSVDLANPDPVNAFNSGAMEKPVFRVNRGRIVLNDVQSGVVVDVTSHEKLDNWPSVVNPTDKTSAPSPADAGGSSFSVPPNITLGARPGRTSMLHVLDNVVDPNDQVLAIVGEPAFVSPVAGASVAVSPDRQTIAVTLPVNITAPVVLRYSVSNGSAPKSGNVTVSPHPLSADEPPSKFELREARHPVAPLRVGVGGSVTAPVLTDWRDGDGDSLSLVGQPTVQAGGVAVVTADGGLRYTASSVGGPVAIGYVVSDGEGKTVSGTLSVLVGGPGDRFAPTPRPDVIQVTAGHSTTFYPLANDFPGVDQTNSGAALVLAGPINSSDLTVVTDTRTGSVTITPPTGAAQRSYPLDYVAGFGQAPTATGTIRVDVVSPGATTAPIAMPDVAVLRGQSPALVDVLANDYSPSGALLAVESASVVDDPGLQVAVQDSRWLRVSALATLPPGRTQIVNYVVTDGTQSVATGQVTVTQLPALDPDIPVTRDDSTIVRAGDIVSVPVLDNDADPNGDPLVLVQDVRDDSVPAGQLAVTGPDGKRPVRHWAPHSLRTERCDSWRPPALRRSKP